MKIVICNICKKEIEVDQNGDYDQDMMEHYKKKHNDKYEELMGETCARILSEEFTTADNKEEARDLIGSKYNMNEIKWIKK